MQLPQGRGKPRPEAQEGHDSLSGGCRAAGRLPPPQTGTVRRAGLWRPESHLQLDSHTETVPNSTASVWTSHSQALEVPGTNSRIGKHKNQGAQAGSKGSGLW